MAQPARGGAAARDARPGEPRRRVLAIDDSPEVLDLLRAVLEDEGYEVSASIDAVGVEEVVGIGPDLIVLDVLFGREQRGLDLLRRLRAEEATAEIPVVLCSGATEPIRRIDGDLLGGATGLVLKPFDVDGLLAEVDRVLAVGASGGR